MLKRVALGLCVVLVVFVALGAYARLRLAPEHFDNVVSIKTLPSYQDPTLLERAWALPAASTYARPPLAQSNPSACGPTSMANVLRSLGNAQATTDEAASAAGCTLGFCMGGRTLDQLADALRSPKWKVTVLRGLTVDQLREELKHANDPKRRYLANFHRGPLFGQGGGHHSPIGGTLEELDLVLVIDVNASYGPWLVPLDRLQQAMATVDASTGQSRGLIRIEL